MTSEMIPTMIPGVMPLNGKKNPVRLVAAVLIRNSALHRLSFFPTSNPPITTRPDAIPIKLMTTCTLVKRDRFENMIVSPRGGVLKVRDHLKSYDEDPGWYEHPAGTMALKATDTELRRDGIDLKKEPSAG
jgi:hypothetical protein